MKDIGIYIHIPFCKSKCYYCDFTSFANKEDMIDEYISCVINELRNKARHSYNVKTIFIGGGTPSYIDEQQIEKIITTIRKYYNVSENAEISIEVNPGTVNKEKLECYLVNGINRLSIGLQSTNNDILHEIGRIHNYRQFEDTVKLAKEVGFENINSDIIIGLPKQTIYDVENTINKLIDLNLTHISVYSLIVEENTILENKIKKKQLVLPDEEIERYMYWYAKRKLEKNGFIHYEISNYAKPGYMCKHNMDCWNQKEYLGFGVSASSYKDMIRYSNTDCIETYINNIRQNNYEKNICIEEKQSEKDQKNEFMMLGLRKIKGVNLSEFKIKFKENPLELYKPEIKELAKENLIDIDINSIKLSKKGLDLANVVWEKFV